MSHHTPRAQRKLERKYKKKSTHWKSKKINPRIEYKPKPGFGLFSKSCGVEGCKISIGKGNNPLTFTIPGSKKKIEKTLSEQQEEPSAVSTTTPIESKALYKQESADEVTDIMSGGSVVEERLSKPITYEEDTKCKVQSGYKEGEGVKCDKPEEISERRIKGDF